MTNGVADVSCIAVCVDGSAVGQRALETAIALSLSLDAELELVVVRRRPVRAAALVIEVVDEVERDLLNLVERLALEQAEEAAVHVRIRRAYGHRAATRLAATLADLVVLGDGGWFRGLCAAMSRRSNLLLVRPSSGPRRKEER